MECYSHYQRKIPEQVEAPAEIYVVSETDGMLHAQPRGINFALVRPGLSSPEGCISGKTRDLRLSERPTSVVSVKELFHDHKQISLSRTSCSTIHHRLQGDLVLY